MWGLIGRLLIGALIAGVAVVVIKGIIDERKLRDEMRQRNIKRALVSNIDRTSNKVTLKDLDKEAEIEFQGDEISSDIRKGQRIYA
ncbi:MAG: hypothetical protein IJG30_06940 [Synergistaceae bacterium]|nr:hypothetical protein [Synergistaceae bacterium]MBQ3585257.1 hypothetical protein [Synergistaceae bacterium]